MRTLYLEECALISGGNSLLGLSVIGGTALVGGYLTYSFTSYLGPIASVAATGIFGCAGAGLGMLLASPVCFPCGAIFGLISGATIGGTAGYLIGDKMLSIGAFFTGALITGGAVGYGLLKA